MGARGKQSAAALAVIQPSSITAIHRPDPPDELTSDQAFEWRAVVDRMPADWFPRETHPMLIQYCRHIVSARHIAQMIDNFLDDGSPLQTVETYNKLLIMQSREGRDMSSLATRMRISQHAQYNHKKTTGRLLPSKKAPHES